MTKHTRRPASEYVSLLERKRQEGMSYAQLSKESGIPACTLQYWARKQRVSAASQSEAHAAGAFIEVNVESVPASAIEVVIGSDLRIAVRPGFDPATLRSVLDTLAC